MVVVMVRELLSLVVVARRRPRGGGPPGPPGPRPAPGARARRQPRGGRATRPTDRPPGRRQPRRPPPPPPGWPRRVGLPGRRRGRPRRRAGRPCRGGRRPPRPRAPTWPPAPRPPPPRGRPGAPRASEDAGLRPPPGAPLLRDRQRALEALEALLHHVAGADPTFQLGGPQQHVQKLRRAGPGAPLDPAVEHAVEHGSDLALDRGDLGGP